MRSKFRGEQLKLLSNEAHFDKIRTQIKPAFDKADTEGKGKLTHDQVKNKDKA